MDRDGRPRKRFLSQRRQQLASALVPNLGAMAAACAAFALIDLFGLGASTHAIVPEAAAALALGGCAMAAALLGRNLAALTVLSVMGPCVALLASAWIVRVTGGDGGPVAILVALVTAVVMGFVHLSFRSALLVAAVACGAQLATGVHSLFAAVLVVAAAGGGLLAARVRHRRALDQFRRVERLTAALTRLRALQDQD